MYNKRFWLGLVPVWVVLAFLGGVFVRARADVHAQTESPVAFTYQGQLQENGTPAEGNYDLRFRLYNAEEGGNPLGEVVHQNVSVSQGRFSVLLPFMPEVLEAEPGYLEIAVRPGGSEEEFTPLSPRQALTRVPFAWRADRALVAAQAEAVPWSGISGKPAGLEDGDNDTTYSAGSGLVLDDSTFALDGAYLDAQYWRLGGNALGSESTMLGSTDNQSWGLMVNGVEALSLSSAGEGQATIKFTQNAGSEEAIEIGERYRDNGIVAWGQVNGNGELISGLGVDSVSINSDNSFHVVLNVAADASSFLMVTATPVVDEASGMPISGLTLVVSKVDLKTDGKPEFDVFIIEEGTITSGFYGFDFIVTGR